MAVQESSTKFRPGESTGKPFGGKIADKPFPQVLRELALERGFESQMQLAKALGSTSHNLVAQWYQGVYYPVEQHFEKLLEILQPIESQLNALTEYYSQHQANSKPKSEKPVHAVSPKTAKRLFPFPTYSDMDAAKNLGVSNNTVGRLRARFHIPILITNQDIEFFRQQLEK